MELEIIPINQLDNLFFDANNELDKLDLNRFFYVTNLTFISKLISKDDFPFDNKRIAINNILKFLNYIDMRLKESNDSIIQIHTDILIDHFNSRLYKSYMNLLKSLNIMSDVPYPDGTFYQQGSYAKQYRIHNEYLNNDDLCIVMMKEQKTIYNIDNSFKLDNRFISTVQNEQINIKEAVIAEIIHCRDNNLSSNNLRMRLSKIFSLQLYRYLRKGVKVDRIYHSLTGLSKVARKHLTTKFYNIDIVNTQPLLLVAYLKKNNLGMDGQYQIDCEEGNFYEQFTHLNDNRDEIKVNLYRSIFFAFKSNHSFNMKFKELYPLTWQSLNEINKTENTLACHLQNVESELFNNLKPKKSKKYFTLFDAIYFDNVLDLGELQKDIDLFFYKLNVRVKTKIEF